MSHSITCSKCSGKGRIEIPEAYRKTVEAVRRLENPTVSEICKEVKQGSRRNYCPSAINQQVRRLIAFGVLESDGKRPMRVWIP